VAAPVLDGDPVADRLHPDVRVVVRQVVEDPGAGDPADPVGVETEKVDCGAVEGAVDGVDAQRFGQVWLHHSRFDRPVREEDVSPAHLDRQVKPRPEPHTRA